MKERLITFICALGALALFFTMFLHQDPHGLGASEVPRPTTEERGENGYQAAMLWLDHEHIRAISLRERYDRLPKLSLPPAGNVLIVTLPATAMFKTDEFRPLDHWVRTGNTLVVLAALSDTPDWAFSFGGMTSGDLNLLTGLEFESSKLRDSRLRKGTDAKDAIVRLPLHYPTGKRETLLPNREHAYFTGVNQVVALTDYESQPWTVKVPYEGFVLALAHQRETGEGVLWTRPLGSGRIVVSGLGSIFTNRALGLADNARLLSNLVSANLGVDGAVLFDDVHQGLGANYDPVKFYRDPRLHLTIAIVAGLWLSWVLGATRLRFPTARNPVPREAELVRATGGFLARVLTPAAAVRRMFEHFLKHRSWEVLERQPRIAAADLAQLRSWYSQSGTARVPLVRLHNLMRKINRQLNS
ncbi:MAG: DUF4350 domain-containing protein [Proteobacteria bacterium]|nr:DUF4350 domain-containing protein [Pseudomonadota bacterium]